MQNKPNLLNAKMNVTSLITVEYENIANCKLCENKAKTKPIKAKTNPIRTQNKPNQTQFPPKFLIIFIVTFVDVIFI